MVSPARFLKWKQRKAQSNEGDSHIMGLVELIKILKHPGSIPGAACCKPEEQIPSPAEFNNSDPHG